MNRYILCGRCIIPPGEHWYDYCGARHIVDIDEILHILFAWPKKQHKKLVFLRKLTSRDLPCMLWAEDAQCYVYRVATALFHQQINSYVCPSGLYLYVFTRGAICLDKACMGLY
ncbi:hypothetical protein OE88DRAFT_1773995 [Heliocybe sulcata]|uniref:Uncharacterized protein n=1 Tax=Heliocybe sulcata TaxID=5364 RepID=A0A5C3MT71_9AGAM|nr:hypothetical protein OE88DRAFT_1773995 [Heliocybe sulcata]